MNARMFSFFCICSILFIMNCDNTPNSYGDLQGYTPLPEIVTYDFQQMTDERWVSSENFEISINSYGNPGQSLTSGFIDYKPSWSKTGSMITFFRLVDYGDYSFENWVTQICTVNADGTGFRTLTNAGFPDFNATWTRDGTNQIIFNRHWVNGRNTCAIYSISPTGSPGEEQLLSDPAQQDYEWAMSGLTDGRLFITRGTLFQRVYLLTPNPGGTGTYEEITRPTIAVWHKLSVSPSETKIAYMERTPISSDGYIGDALYYADFDVVTRTVSNPVLIAAGDPRYANAYPRWTSDETIITYYTTREGTSQIYAYRLSDGVTARISPDQARSYYFACFENTPK